MFDTLVSRLLTNPTPPQGDSIILLLMINIINIVISIHVPVVMAIVVFVVLVVLVIGRLVRGKRTQQHNSMQPQILVTIIISTQPH
mmetsp:Transcript_32302/g.63112  ORF Transcript_32302/g.63112 Transcript_32302/m.63112 type:complete len:86 (+) Transcript_32302:230-487(+)